MLIIAEVYEVIDPELTDERTGDLITDDDNLRTIERKAILASWDYAHELSRDYSEKHEHYSVYYYMFPLCHDDWRLE